jgi:acetoin utilization deacetylase AcuC-like enzyme
VALQALADEPAAELRAAAPADRAALELVHPPAYLDRVEALAAAGGGALDPDTMVGPSSWPAVLGAAGATLAAVEAALADGAAFAAIRPPGHHALADRAMGFCVVNNVMLGARHAQRRGAERALIVDWDVHHGNGTQAIVERDPSVRFVSLHQWPWYPGTGAASERGVGNVFNLPRPPGLSPDAYVEALWEGVVAATAGWTPGVVLLSAGYDAMRGDPLGGFTLEPEHYAVWVHRIRHRWPGVPIAGVLEGGYAPDRVGAGVRATVRALAG